MSNELFNKLVDEAVERKLRQLAETTADKVVARMLHGQAPAPHPEPRRRRVLFSAHTIVAIHPNAERLAQRHEGKQRQLLEAIILVARDKGPARKVDLVHAAASFAGESVARVSSAASLACRKGILVVQEQET